MIPIGYPFLPLPLEPQLWISLVPYGAIRPVTGSDSAFTKKTTIRGCPFMQHNRGSPPVKNCTISKKRLRNMSHRRNCRQRKQLAEYVGCYRPHYYGGIPYIRCIRIVAVLEGSPDMPLAGPLTYTSYSDKAHFQTAVTIHFMRCISECQNDKVTIPIYVYLSRSLLEPFRLF